MFFLKTQVTPINQKSNVFIFSRSLFCIACKGRSCRNFFSEKKNLLFSAHKLNMEMVPNSAMEEDISMLKKRINILEHALRLRSKKCLLCKFSSSSMNMLDRHLYDRHGWCHRADGTAIKLYGCPQCEAESSRKANVELHYALQHLDDEPKFKKPGDYITHLRQLGSIQLRDVTRPKGYENRCRTDKPQCKFWPTVTYLGKKPIKVEVSSTCNSHDCA
jgi:hypothetical protein